MRFGSPLTSGRLVKRYKRFLADIILDDGTAVTASCPNTGAMLGLTTPGARVWVSASDSPTRKYRHALELVEAEMGAGTVIVGINTGHPNRIVREAIEAGGIAALTGYPSLKPEQRYGLASRIDLLLECPKRGAAYVEVKNVHLVRTPGLAEFPDSVTARGAKHLDELASMVAAGHRAVMVYLIQRRDADRLAFAADIDPAYAEAFARALTAGVEAIALGCHVSPEAIEVDRMIPIVGTKKA